MGNLTTFLYNLLRQKTSDQASNVWLPKVLQPYCPIVRNDEVTIDPKQLGNDISDQLVNVYGSMVELALDGTDLYKKVFPPNPCVRFSKDMKDQDGDTVLKVSNIVMKGVENIAIKELKDTDRNDQAGTYTLFIPVNGPAYDPTTAQLEDYSVEFDFCINQKLCVYEENGYDQGNYQLAKEYPVEEYLPGGWPQCEMTINGHMVSNLVDPSKESIYLTAKVIYGIATDSNGRTIDAQVDNLSADIYSLVLNSKHTITKMTVNYPDYIKLFNVAFGSMLANHNVVDAILTKVFEALNGDGMKKDMSNRLSQYTLTSFDKVLGHVQGSLPSTTSVEKNKVDQYIFDRIRYALCSNESKYYLPKVIENCEKPDLKDWDLGRIDLGSFSSDTGFSIDHLVLTDVRMQGLQNLSVDVNGINFKAATDEHPDLATMTALLTLKIFGGIEMTMNGETILGSFQVDTNNIPFYLECVISGSLVDDIVLQIHRAELQSAEKAFHITLTIDGVLKDLVESIFNSTEVQPMLLTAFSDAIMKRSDEISQKATEMIKQVLNEANA